MALELNLCTALSEILFKLIAIQIVVFTLCP